MQKENIKTWRKRLNEWAEDNIPVLVFVFVIAVLTPFAIAYSVDKVIEFSDKLGTVFGLVSTAIAVFTWYSVRRIRNSIKPVKPMSLFGEKVAVLCISCINPDPAQDKTEIEVARYLYEEEKEMYENCYKLPVVGENSIIGEYRAPDFCIENKTVNQYSASYITSSDIDGKDVPFGRGRFISVKVQGYMPSEYAQEYTTYVGCCLEHTISQIQKSKIKKLKVFCYTPIGVGALIGYMVRNNMEIEFYHHFSQQENNIKHAVLSSKGICDGSEEEGRKPKDGYVSMGAFQLSWITRFNAKKHKSYVLD